MKHIYHPIIGDRPHGCNKQNKFFIDNWNMKTMLLHARKVIFQHPIIDKKLEIEAPIYSQYLEAMKILNFETSELEKEDSFQ